MPHPVAPSTEAAPTPDEVRAAVERQAADYHSYYAERGITCESDLACHVCATSLLTEAVGLIHQLLTSPCDEILNHSAREFLARFTSPANAAAPCGPSSPSASSPAASPEPSSLSSSSGS